MANSKIALKSQKITQTGYTAMVVAKQILIIEDDVSLCETLQLYIQREGWNCLIANNAGQGIKDGRRLQAKGRAVFRFQFRV